MAGGILGAIAADAGGNVPDKNLIRNTLMTCWDVAEETFSVWTYGCGNYHRHADTSKPNMGLTSFSGKASKRTDTTVAKNYLDVDELDTLNRIVSFYLEFAELQARTAAPCTCRTGSPSSTIFCVCPNAISSPMPERSATNLLLNRPMLNLINSSNVTKRNRVWRKEILKRA
ncbi:unnamed protein product [Sphagnum balticum]